ncbi:MAG: hypothetical protein JSW56_02515 [Deltaproteobacteria bacterium]|nr:MAG: hypothetical protein JSW56_02515 [Deltaproteobacteria bacterium]
MYPDPKPFTRGFFLAFCIMLCHFLIFPSSGFSKKEHIVYFPNTAYELNVYKIYGKQPGKTLMLIGGIQGNEPGGFLSADLYADMSLAKGNLVVVPRANFYSIILNQRGPHGDMNRKFTNGDTANSIEDKIVTILKKLISESDYLLNLHDGMGYYYPKHINKWRNPMRFGQTIIADCSEYTVPGNNRVIKLEEMAQKVLDEVNPHIENELHKFHFMNTKTGDKDSPHGEQRKSATYYALTEHHIPAFGVETSKFLPSIDLKVRYHNLVINAFKEIFGIIPESPGLVLDPPLLKYLVVSINGQIPIVVKENQVLELQAGDSIHVSHIESNYERGLSLDILGYGDLNDYRREFVVFRNTSIIVRKDNHIFAEIPLKISKKRLGGERVESRPAKLDYFVVETKGHRILLSDGETLDLVKGDKLKIVDILPSFPDESGITVNFKGFVGDWNNNTGEDRGYVIDTGADLINRYSLHKKGEFYEVITSKGANVIGRMAIRLTPPRMEYLILKVNDNKHVYLRPGDAVSLAKNDKICLQEIQTNLYNKRDILLSINGHKIKPGEIRQIKELCGASGYLKHRAEVSKGPLVLGRIFLNMN